MTLAPRERSTLKIRVYYEDTDFSGLVYHASYLRFLERGRTEWLRAHGATHRDIAASEGIAFVVRGMTIEFLGPARIDDLLAVETWADAPRGASIAFRQRVLLDDKAIVEATARVAAIRNGRPARLPRALREALARPHA